MRFLMQIYQGEALEAWARMSPDEQQAYADAYRRLNETPGVTPGEGLDMPGSATTVRVDGDRTVVTDGPFADTKEALGGYFFFDGESVEAAVAVAAKVPAAHHGGAVEIRPIKSW
jgi:hypothetical protein